MNEPSSELIPVHVGGVQVGWKHPDTGVYTPAVRCDLPGQSVTSFPRPILRDGEDR